MKIKIENKSIGQGENCLLVAEAGTTCNGHLPTAIKLTDAAAEAGYDAIKFQTIWPEQISDDSTLYRYKTASGWEEENMIEMFSHLLFSPAEWLELAKYVRSRGLIFFSTVDYLNGVDLLEECNVPIHKMGSWDVTYEPLIIKMAKTGKPVMIDLGPATLSDIISFIDLCKQYGTGEVILLHDFHTETLQDMNLRNIPFLQKTLHIPVGFSSPTRNDDLDIIAMALGADVIEKRITLDSNQDGHHHVLSLEPRELKPWIQKMRAAEACLGSYEIIPSEADRSDARKYYRSICTTRPIKKGEMFSMENLDGKRPGTGIPTKNLDVFLGRPARRDFDANTMLAWDDI